MSSYRFVETAFLINFLTANKIKGLKDHGPEITEWRTSCFVKCEVRKRLIQDAIYLYNLYLFYDRQSDLDRRVNNLQHSLPRKHAMVRRILNHIQIVLESFDRSYFGEADRFETIKLYLKDAIFEYLEIANSFLKIDETKCVIGASDPEYNEDEEEFDNRMKFVYCNDSHPRCEIRAFFENHDSEIRTIVDCLEGIEKIKVEDSRMLTMLNDIISDHGIMPDRNHCWNCGDAIIVCEAPNDHIILHYDKTFRVTAPAIGKEEVYLEPDKP